MGAFTRSHVASLSIYKRIQPTESLFFTHTCQGSPGWHSPARWVAWGASRGGDDSGESSEGGTNAGLREAMRARQVTTGLQKQGPFYVFKMRTNESLSERLLVSNYRLSALR